jgi:integrase
MATIERLETTHGVRYKVRWWSDGRRIEKRVRTQDEARAIKLQAERDSFLGVVHDPRPARRVLNAYFEEWIERRLVKGRPLRLSTKSEYRKLWHRHVESTLGTKQLRSIDIEAVNKWHYDVVANSGSNQAAKAYRTLRAVLRTAEAEQIIRACPCRIRGGGQEHPDERPLVETSLVLALAAVIDERVRAIVVLAGFASLRTGESLGLRRRDLNLLHATVDVTTQSQEIDGKQVFVDHTKSDAGRRTVALPRVVVEILDDHLARFVDPEPDALLFTSPLTGEPLTRGVLSEKWLAAVAATDAPEGLRIHDLRHHAATMAARTPGITLKELMARIGHSTPHAALRYQHAAAERDRAVATYLDGLIENARATGS